MSVGTDWAEKRAHPREQVHRPGVVVHGRSGRSIPCTILDVSLGGARVLLAEPELPEIGLTLIDQQKGTLADCKIVWRKGHFAGVSFDVARPKR
ncbi:MAG TPA: PilZ domain-containing protein [Caulobacteraceae bacterium]|jgi:hypothetical protein